MKIHRWFALAAALAGAGDLRAESITLLVSHCHCRGCGAQIAKALAKVPSAKLSGKIGRGDGPDGMVSVPVVFDPAKSDVGELAKAVAGADTPHRDSRGAPSATLVFPAPKITPANAKKVPDALKDVKGVNAAASRGDVSKKEIHVKLDDQGDARLADIEKALADYR